MSNKHQKQLSSPWFDLVCKGKKKVEGRLDKGSFHGMKVGDKIEWYNNDTGKKRKCLTKITKITKYPSFGEMLRKEGVDIVLPGVEGIRLGVNAYRNYYTVQEENRYGVLAIELVIV